MDGGQIGLAIAVLTALTAIWQTGLSSRAATKQRIDDRVEVERWRTETEGRVKALEARIEDRPRKADVAGRIDMLEADMHRRSDAAAAEHSAIRAGVDDLKDRFARLEVKLDQIGKVGASA